MNWKQLGCLVIKEAIAVVNLLSHLKSHLQGRVWTVSQEMGFLDGRVYTLMYTYILATTWVTFS